MGDIPGAGAAASVKLQQPELSWKLLHILLIYNNYLNGFQPVLPLDSH